jgi:ABC-type Mn2+/Zn2+ transport system permease subunit
VATTTGTYAARILHRPPGPLVVIVASACFVLSLFSSWGRRSEAS